MAEQTGMALSQTSNAKALVYKWFDRPRGWMVWSERVVLLVLVALFTVKGFIPAWEHLNTDFPNYYIGAQLYRRGYPIERVYEWIWFQRQVVLFGRLIPKSSFMQRIAAAGWD
jgi:hypothetical protein